MQNTKMNTGIKWSAALVLLLTFSGLTAFAAEEKAKKNAYEKLFSGKKQEVAEGMFTVRRLGDKVYFEIPDSLFGQEMLLGSTVSAISDNGDCLVGQKPQKPLHVFFTRRDSTVLLHQVVARKSVVDAGYENIGQALRLSRMPVLLKRFSVKAWRPADSTAVIDATPLFMEDIKELRPFDNGGGSSMGGMASRSVRFNKSLCYIDGVKAFADNVSVKSMLSYTSDLKLLGMLTLAKDKPTAALLTRTFLRLPREVMHPRPADSRIGVFFQGVEHFASDDDQVKALYYANRWRVEPSDEEAWKRGEKVEPVRPIVFYVDPAFPEAWKPAIKAGIEDWNLAFEKIGFKNAVKAVDFPSPGDDPEFDPDNLKYSCVRYAPTWVANAMGPSWKDPRSGEILCASVYIHHNVIKLLNNWRFVLTAQVDESVRCKTLPEDVLQEGLRYVAAHEVGHCLGLMHNMAASSAYPVDSLRSASFTATHGTTPSIMDYARFNYVAQPGDKGVRLTPPLIGLYDDYVIRWLYTPLYGMTETQEKATLDGWIAEKAGNPLYRYGKQQVYARYDPSSVEEDLGDDPVKASAYGISNLKYIMAHIDEWFEADDPDFSHRQAIYSQILNQYKRYLNNVAMNIGGLYLYDVRQAEQRDAFRPVPGKVQKESLEFLFNQLCDMDWLRYERLERRLSPALSAAEQLQYGTANYLNNLISLRKRNAVLLASGYADSEDAYTLEEYMADLYKKVWPSKNTLSEREMAWQTTYVKALLSSVNPSLKAGSVLLADPQRGEAGTLDVLDWTYAPTADEILLYDLAPGAETYAGLLYAMEEGRADAPEDVNAFAWQREVKVGDLHDVKALSYDYLLKLRDFLSRHKNVSDSKTRLHYRHLLYKIDSLMK